MCQDIKSICRLLRPQQWLKNVFIFMPMFFGGELLNVKCWGASLTMALCFILLSSAIYCVNDVRDKDSDAIHPWKRHRPVATGEVSGKTALTVAVVLTVCSFAVGLLCHQSNKVVVVLAGYFLLNIAYCFKLKQVAIIDVMIISFGFVFRLVGGGVVCNIRLSPWIVLMTFLIALFLAFSKRRDDVIIRLKEGINTRDNTLRYNMPFMNVILGMLGAITIVCYILYTVSLELEARLGNQYVYLSSVFVIAGLLRYLQVVIVDTNSGSPTGILLHDRFIQCCVVCWIIQFVIMIYL